MKNEKKTKPSGMNIQRETIRPLSGDAMTRAHGGLAAGTCTPSCSHTTVGCTKVGSNNDW